MSFVQGLNVVLPLITFPYLIRVLGIEGFGTINYALALVNFFVVFVDFGYNLTATRDVAHHQHDKHKLAVLFNVKWQAQALLLVLSTIIFGLVVALVPAFNAHSSVFWLSYGLVPATILLPVWFFQGTENFGQLARLQLLSRGLYTAAIFIWVKQADDLLLVPLFNSAAALLAAFWALFSLFRTTGIRPVRIAWSQMFASLKESSGVFISSFSVSLYSHSAILLLGFFGSEKMVGQFAAVEKIILVFRLGLSTLFSVVYPRLCQLIIISTNKARAFLRQLFGSVAIMVALACLFIWGYPQEIVQFVTGENDPEIALLLRWMALVPLFIALNMASYQQLLAHKRQRYYSSVLLAAALGSIALNIGLTPVFGALGTTWSILFAESFITFGLLFATEFRYRSLSIWRKPG